MAKPAKNSSISLRSLVFWAACFALLASFSMFVLEKTRVTNFYTKPVATDTATNSTSRPVNSVDYSPATSAEKPTNEQKTQDTAATPSTVTPTSSINITLSAAGQDSASGPVVVRTILDNTTGGSCTITLTKGSTVKTYSASITWQGTYYSCNKDIPYTDISAGEWQLKLVATQDSKQGTATKVISVNGG